MKYKNILIAGRTGAGKSSLVNYIAGRKVAEVGVGRPVTSRDDVASYAMSFMGVPIRMFDSWGIEADKTSDWKNRTMKMIADVGETSGSEASWFHTVVYCIPAQNGRIEPIDVEMIEYFKSQSFSVVVALTNADRTADDDMAVLESSLPSSVLHVRLSSGGRTRYFSSDPFGKEELLGMIVRSALKNLPVRTEKHFKSVVESWRQDMTNRLRYKDVSRISNGDIERWIKRSAEDQASVLNREFKEFLSDEISAVVVWGKHVADEIPECNVFVAAMEERELGVGDYIGMTICAPLMIAVGVGFLLFGSAESERRKLQEKINDAAWQMHRFVEKAVVDFSKMLPTIS